MHMGKLVIGIAVLVCPYASNCRILDISESGSVQAVVPVGFIKTVGPYRYRYT